MLGKTSCFQCPEGRAGTKAKTATNARPGRIMQISAVLVKLAQRANIKRSLAKVRVSFVREENIGSSWKLYTMLRLPGR